MLLGKGDIGLNARVTSEGNVRSFISKIEAWDDNARPVKVGALRVHLEPNPCANNPPFRQMLSLRAAAAVVALGHTKQREPTELQRRDVLLTAACRTSDGQAVGRLEWNGSGAE